ncbi:MAG: DNA topoisomerase IB [Pseudomonadota bacterium]
MARDTADLGPPDLPEHLVYCADDGPGIARKGKPPLWSYEGPDGETVKDDATLERIRALVIPPAWTDVWIAPKPSCHVQATGRDARGRKQYRYHADWRSARDEGKFDRMAAFGRALPKLRKRLETDLARRGLPKAKVLAAVIRMLEITLIRVGNDEYAKTNKSFGLTTMQKRHVTLTGAGAVFSFRGKSGKQHRTGFHDRRLARIVRACADLRGQRLFQYVDEDGQTHGITSGDVNDYLREAMGDDFTAKDFRTWFGTVGAARALCLQEAPGSATAAKQAVNACVKAVAGVLGNTPAVCRKAYIHPAVIEAFSQGRLKLKTSASERGFETAVLRMLEAA